MDQTTVTTIDQPGTRDLPSVAPQVSESAELINMIERAARDPSIDIQKMRELMALRKEIIADAAKLEFDRAMAQAQAEMSPVARDANNPQTKSKYASYAKLDRVLRPIYSKHGFSISFDTGEAPEKEYVRVLGYVTRPGHTRSHHIDLPADGKGAKGGDVMTKTHAAVSAVTYGRRNLLTMMFNIAVGDDDGNAASNTKQFITEKQVAELTKLIVDSGGDVAKFCAFAKVESLDCIYAGRYEAAVEAVKRAAAQRKKSEGAKSAPANEQTDDTWPGPISKDQAKTLLALIVETKSDLKKFCKHMGVQSVEAIGARDYDRAVTALESKKKVTK